MPPTPPADVQLPFLDTFVRAAELLNFTATAEALGITQAAVSQRIHALEQSLGVALFQRRGGQVQLSEAGHKLYPFAQNILLLHAQAREQIAGTPLPLAGELSLAASSVPGTHLLPELLAEFQQRHPHVHVRATVTDSQTVLDQVERGEVDLGLVGMRADRANLEFEHVADDTLTLVVAPDHPWSRRKRVTLAELRKEALILREAGSGSRQCLEQALAQAGTSLRQVGVSMMELGSNEAIREMVQRGRGAAVLSTRAVAKDCAEGRLHSLQIGGLPLRREIFVVRDRRRVVPIPARLFLDLLAARQKSDLSQ